MCNRKLDRQIRWLLPDWTTRKVARILTFLLARAIYWRQDQFLRFDVLKDKKVKVAL